MATPLLPIQLSGASASAAGVRKQEAPSGDGAQFSAALSREVSQRQAPVAPATPKPASAPNNNNNASKTAEAKNADPAKPATPAKADGASDQPPSDQAAHSADNTSAADGSAQDAQAAAAAAASAAAAATPVVDMLALVASFNQPLQGAPAAAAPAAPVLSATAPLATTAPVDPTIVDRAALNATAPAASAAELAIAPAAAPADAAAAFELPAMPAQAEAALAQSATAPVLQRATSVAFERIAKPASAAAEAPRLGALTPTLVSAAPASTIDGKRSVPDLSTTGGPAVRTDAAETAATPVGTAPAAAVAASADKLAVREAPEPFTLIKETAPAAVATAPLQQAALNVAQTINGASDKISARVGTPGWDNQVAQKIVWMVAGKEQSATLTLNPPDLGPMQVVLSVNNDQANVTFTAAQPEVRQALEDSMSRLRDMMSENGIALGNANVNAGTSDQRQADSGANGGRASGGNGAGASGGDGGRSGVNDNGSASAAAARSAARPQAGGAKRAVDTFA